MIPNAEQRRAAAPEASAWVAANAGSGKTAVLTDRVARLLLGGTEPARILCLTYTKAAAAEMQTRLFGRLGQWAMLEDARLLAELEALGETGPALAPARLARARTLFARALETPGGLKIQTIHAFCDALLRRFPLEAGVSPAFGVLEDRQAQALRLEALETLAEADPGTVEALARYLTGDKPDPLLAEIATHRTCFEGHVDFAARLGHAPSLSVEALAAEVLDPATRRLLATVAPAIAAGSNGDRRCATKIAEALVAEPMRALALLEDVFLHGKTATASGPFTSKRGKLPTLGTRAALGLDALLLDDLMDRVEAARPRRLALAASEKTAALHRFARAWLATYAGAKGHDRLDFDDLIARSVVLLSEPATAAFVLWRLDGGLDHVLVDEAQDTSPEQWRVVQAITEEFFAGEGARRLPHAAPRTVFVVGDEKQSIYSFQGADPAAFADMRSHFEARLEGMARELRRCDLDVSYRSAAPVLALVDAVFGGPAGSTFSAPVVHRPKDPERPGRVELWPFLARPEKPEEPPWDRPLDLPMPDDPVERLADALAAEIRGWLEAGRLIATRKEGIRPIAPSDILVLVQRRSTVFHPLIRALKRHRVPVAGADVLRIGGELAVKDLLAALRVAVTPADDLTLAALLRSPLGGLAEDGLFHLAHGRSRSLIDALDRSEHAAAIAFVQDLRDQADYLPPYEMVERILAHHDGRRRLTGRLGLEAEDGIDALLAQALVYESVEPPTLTGFLAWIGRGELTVKRRTDEAAGEVRVMTVHGAKGLEAPVVILPDTAKRQEVGRRPEILRLADGTPAWSMRSEDCPPPLAEAETERRARVAAENRRLLYVALTRAESWLIVAGAGDLGRDEGESWHATVEAAMHRLGAAPEGDRLVLASGWPDGRAAHAAPSLATPVLPSWTGSLPPPVPAAAAPVSPSVLGGAHALPGEATDEDLLARGSRLHLLLEALAGRARADRAALAARLLPDALDRDALLAEAEAVLDAPALASLFGPGARAEVGIVAPFGAGRLLGRIDRLLVEPDRVLAADFKSNRVVPARPEDTPEAILRQMGAYAAALAGLYPGRAIETGIVWTRGPAFMPLPASLSRAALARALP
jgi:ATP-dependent helicase/nuclease subunit A